MSSSMNEYFNRIITDAKRAKMRSGVNQQVAQQEKIRKGIHRIPGKSEETPVVKPLHYYVFCSHEVPYWRTCTKCGRDKELARRNAEMILQKSTVLKSS